MTATLVLAGCGGGQPVATTTATPSPSPTATADPSPSPTPSPVPSPQTTTTQVFFTNADLGDPCTEVFPVVRQVPLATPTPPIPLEATVAALVAGPTDEEMADGYRGWFGDDTADLVLSVATDDGVALVDFDASLPTVIPNASSSCGSSALLAQLDTTVTQFDEVDEGRYSLAGDVAAFYEWLQLAAPDGPDEPATAAPEPEPEPEPAPEPEPEPAPEPEPEPEPPTAPGVPASLVGTEWTRLPTSDRVVALTFDAGANADAVASILATLEATGTPGTFFLTGKWVAAYPAQATRIGDRHPVGNHTQTHPDLTTLPDAEVRDQVERAEAAILAGTGVDPRPWFRSPFGARDDHVIALVNDLDYGSVRWTVDTLGWQGTSGGMTAAKVVDRVMDGLQPGEIVLMHVGSHPTDGSTLDADALPEIIRRIRDAGYRFVDLDDYR